MMVHNSFTPAPIVLPSSSTPEKCPHCHRIENKKVVCRECGYEYPEETDGFTRKDIIIGFVVVIGILWFFVTMISWLFGMHNESLLEVLAGQVQWFLSLRLW